MNAAQLAMHRRNTKRFIDDDPTEIQLSMRAISTVAGTKTTAVSDEREPQIFKIIWQGDNGVVREPPSGARRFDFILLGKHDANVAIGDFWQVENQKFVIEYIFPKNGYEVKAGGVSHGSKPS